MTELKISEKIKPCPFCGSEAEIEDNSLSNLKYFTVKCSNENCGASVHFCGKSESREEILSAWNNRTICLKINDCYTLKTSETLNITL